MENEFCNDHCKFPCRNFGLTSSYDLTTKQPVSEKVNLAITDQVQRCLTLCAFNADWVVAYIQPDVDNFKFSKVQNRGFESTSDYLLFLALGVQLHYIIFY